MKQLCKSIDDHYKRIDGDEYQTAESHTERLNKLIKSLEERYERFLNDSLHNIEISSSNLSESLVILSVEIEDKKEREPLLHFLENKVALLRERKPEHNVLRRTLKRAEESLTKCTLWDSLERIFSEEVSEQSSRE